MHTVRTASELRGNQLIMTLDDITLALLASYESNGGINHLDGVNLPSEESVNRLAVDCMHLLFPGYFDQTGISRKDIAAHTAARVRALHDRFRAEIEKSLRFAEYEDPVGHAEHVTMRLLGGLPGLRDIVQTDVQAAYNGDPAARSLEEIILAYPCVLVISLQRIAHLLYNLAVPILPRMITEYAHEKTGTDIHPGARIGSHFFIDHCTGVVIGETAIIGSHVKIYQGVTLGAKSFEVDNHGNPIKGVKRHPNIGDHVTIYSHATILGGDTTIGEHTIVGANVWLLESIPAHCIAYYKGENLVVRSRRKQEKAVETRNQDELQAWNWSI
ncbi:serine O-acetyltransferase [Geminisphaera colitermitum]|uniref:serine O-acetyltransferase n=1 Tax=Geminisphaera colitermitum TaxID=1148786 RepID=UPI000307237B|nr:serine O-acetyltransferase [Geminisphaera colitermitum]